MWLILLQKAVVVIIDEEYHSVDEMPIQKVTNDRQTAGKRPQQVCKRHYDDKGDNIFKKITEIVMVFLINAQYARDEFIFPAYNIALFQCSRMYMYTIRVCMYTCSFISTLYST